MPKTFIRKRSKSWGGTCKSAPPQTPSFWATCQAVGFSISTTPTGEHGLWNHRPNARILAVLEIAVCLPYPQLISQVSCSSSMHRSSSAGSKHVCILTISEIAECSLGIPFPPRTSSSSHAIRARIGLSERTRVPSPGLLCSIAVLLSLFLLSCIRSFSKS